MYTNTPTDYDLYGNKITTNDQFLINADNVYSTWYPVIFPYTDASNCNLTFSATTCQFVYSVVATPTNNLSFVYNCIDSQGNNVIGFYTSNQKCDFQLIDERIVSNYSTQDNFLIDFNGDGTGVYGIADNFIFFYQLSPTIDLFIWSNTLGISPRGMHIGINQDYTVVAGYCQISTAVANECAFLIRLNTSFSCPNITNKFNIATARTYSWSDPRVIRLITSSRSYTSKSVMSVSICWKTKQVLIGVQSLNTVFLYSLNNTYDLIGSRDNGVGYMGYGKSVSWLDINGRKAVILANTYTYTTFDWISSSIHIYDIESDGFSDSTQPIYIYPNSLQPLQQYMAPSIIRIACSPSGNLGMLNLLGGGVGILRAPPNEYPNTNTSGWATTSVPCYSGTSRDYDGIELCSPYSSSSMNCSDDIYCPYGAVGQVSYSEFESIEQDQDYPEPPESTVFDDLLMQNMFSLNPTSIHCLVVSPITWVLFFMIFGLTISIGIILSEVCCPRYHSIRDKIKRIFRKMDLIGEGEMWIGGLTSSAIIVLVIFAYHFSNGYLHQYPIERVTTNSTFACDVTLRNAKFSTTAQKRWDPARSTKESQTVFDLLNAQAFTLNIDLIQTAFNCQDNFYVLRDIGYKTVRLPINNCQLNKNKTIMTLAVALPVHEISVKLVLNGLKTVGAVRIGVSGPSAQADNERFTAMELNFASTFVSSSFDEVLAETTTFPITLTKIVNQTDPLSSNGLSTFSAIFSSSFNVNSDMLFTNETRYTFIYRTATNITVTITEDNFYVSNLQQPIARQTEVIFHNLLFTIVVLEVFGLVYLVVKLFLIPVCQSMSTRLQKNSPTNKADIESHNDSNAVVVEKKVVQ
ncbi:unnamed protein product [Adineta ricciae]|uniref:Uncharacterized protein n=1 Tax=Adineta ricciae TaxID=249248 RepID=A0A815LXI6_ADIRI|nr:unnamed protein product [Adineta ricciae]CAF1414599.1 unnamed protein product [Adineta ricciae]